MYTTRLPCELIISHFALFVKRKEKKMVTNTAFLRKKMYEKRLTQLELAKLTNTSPSMIGAVIRGTRTPSYSLAQRMATALECEMEDILTYVP